MGQLRKRKQFVLTSRLNKIIKNSKKQNDQSEDEECLGCKKFYSLNMTCVHPALFKNNSRKLRMKVH